MVEPLPHPPPPPPAAVIASMPTYQGRMARDLEWAMTQGSLFFEGRGKVQETLRRIVRRLDKLVGGLRRAAEDLEAMLADGVQLDVGRRAPGDGVWLYTHDRTIAEKYGMHPEDAYL